MIRAVKEKAKLALHNLFELGQHLGVDILPRHFYSEIPDFRELRKANSWKLPRSMHGVNGADVDAQLVFARDCLGDESRVFLSHEKIYEDACRENGAVGYGPIEAEFLFCYAGRYKPRKIVQIGAGVSTAVLLRAGRLFGYSPMLVCIDPHPTEYLRKSAAEGRISLIAERCQDVPLEILADLGPGDMLFVDSTHAVKVGSEVNYLILEAMPRLRGGCHVHFHDIYFPYDYPATLMTTTFFPNETVLLLAFLTGNNRYSIMASLSQLHHCRTKEFEEILPDYHPAAVDHGLWGGPAVGHFPSAIYLNVMEEQKEMTTPKCGEQDCSAICRHFAE